MSLFSEIDEYVVEAPSFDDPNVPMTLDVSASWVRQNAIHGRQQPLMDFWSLVYGAWPPVNNIGYHEDSSAIELPGLKGSHALFCGLKRPMNSSSDESDIYVFVSDPAYLYRYIPDMVCVAKLRPSPRHAVFACYVRRYEEETDSGISGMVLAWEWVRCDDDAFRLPNDHATRYGGQVWS